MKRDKAWSTSYDFTQISIPHSNFIEPKKEKKRQTHPRPHAELIRYVAKGMRTAFKCRKLKETRVPLPIYLFFNDHFVFENNEE